MSVIQGGGGGGLHWTKPTTKTTIPRPGWVPPPPPKPVKITASKEPIRYQYSGLSAAYGNPLLNAPWPSATTAPTSVDPYKYGGLDFGYGFMPPGVTIDSSGKIITQSTDGGGDGGGGGGGRGGGGGGAPPPTTWKESYNLEGAPSWWKGLTPDQMNAESEYAALVNSVIPYLSGEDQRAAAQSLARMAPEFAGYSSGTADFGAPPPDISTNMISKYFGQARSRNITSAIENMAKAAGRKTSDFGPGYTYFKQLAGTLGDFGSQVGNGMSRTKYRQMLGALDPLLAESGGGSLGAFGSIAKMLTQPFFSGGQLSDLIMGTKANNAWY